jgi:hypothetical protein
MSTFLDSVNRVLRNNTVISDDDDDITAFTDVQHRASLLLAKQAIQSTITELTADSLIPVEETDGTVMYIADQRVYSLPADFVKFTGENPFLLEIDGSGVSENQWVSLYPGGEERLKREILDYKSQSGTPRYFYQANGSTKQIGFYQVPGADDDGQVLSFRYEKSIYPINEADSMPFHTDQEDHAFADMASRYFQFLFTKQPIDGLESDIVYSRAKSSLVNLMNQHYQSTDYGYNYR